MLATLLNHPDIAATLLPYVLEWSISGMVALHDNPDGAARLALSGCMFSASLLFFAAEPRGKHAGFARADRRRTRRAVRAGKRAWLAGVAR